MNSLARELLGPIKQISIKGILYTDLERIGSGTFGTVYKAKFQNKQYAIKELVLDDNKKSKSFLNELLFT
jgi:serine/threonine protein kinase